MLKIKEYLLIVIKTKVQNKRLEDILNDILEEAKRNVVKKISKKISYKYIYNSKFYEYVRISQIVVRFMKNGNLINYKV